MAYDTKARPMKKTATTGPTKRMISTSYKGSGSAVGTGVWEGVVVDGVTPGSCKGRGYMYVLIHFHFAWSYTCRKCYKYRMVFGYRMRIILR